jgi:hypothetical protein
MGKMLNFFKTNIDQHFQKNVDQHFQKNVDQHFHENVDGNVFKRMWIQHFLYTNVSATFPKKCWSTFL